MRRKGLKFYAKCADAQLDVENGDSPLLGALIMTVYCKLLTKHCTLEKFPMMRATFIFSLLVALTLVVSGCQTQSSASFTTSGSQVEFVAVTPVIDQKEAVSPASIEFTLQTDIQDGRLIYMGVGGEINGVTNPDLVVQPGAIVRMTLVNGDGMAHDLSLPDFNVKTPLVFSKGQTAEVNFTVGENQTGTYVYFCTQPGHRQAGQEGKLVVDGP